jgi:hypothetical protein
MEKSKMFEILRDDFIQTVEKTEGTTESFYGRMGIKKDSDHFKEPFKRAMLALTLTGNTEGLAEAVRGCDNLQEALLMAFRMGQGHNDVKRIFAKALREVKEEAING